MGTLIFRYSPFLAILLLRVCFVRYFDGVRHLSVRFKPQIHKKWPILLVLFLLTETSLLNGKDRLFHAGPSRLLWLAAHRQQLPAEKTLTQLPNSLVQELQL